MKIWIALTFAAFAVLASAQCPECETLKWGHCCGPQCHCFVEVTNAILVKLDCTKLIPKCFSMKAELHRGRDSEKIQTTGGKPEESADEKYNPECESDGKFKARQCNNNECWCVNSAGIRRTDKGDINLKCDELVKARWVNFHLTHKPVSTALDTTVLKTDIADAIHKRYKNFNKDLVENVEYIPTKRSIVVDVKMRNQSSDLTGTSDLVAMVYYMEKDVKGKTLFMNQTETFEPIVGGQRLEIEDIKVNYIDEKKPSFTPRLHALYGPVIAIVVVVLVIMMVLLGVYFYKRRQRQL